MKLIAITFNLFFAFACFSQNTAQPEEVKLNKDNFNVTYIIDSAYYLRGKQTWMYSDGNENFLMINEGKVLLTCAMVRSGPIQTYSFFGDMDGLKTITNKEGEKVIQFYVRGREFNIGGIMSFEIIINSDNDYTIHYYSKHEGRDVFFTARFPTEQEEKNIKDLFRNF